MAGLPKLQDVQVSEETDYQMLERNAKQENRGQSKSEISQSEVEEKALDVNQYQRLPVDTETLRTYSILRNESGNSDRLEVSGEAEADVMSREEYQTLQGRPKQLDIYTSLSGDNKKSEEEIDSEQHNYQEITIDPRHLNTDNNPRYANDDHDYIETAFNEEDLSRFHQSRSIDISKLGNRAMRQEVEIPPKRLTPDKDKTSGYKNRKKRLLFEVIISAVLTSIILITLTVTVTSQGNFSPTGQMGKRNNTSNHGLMSVKRLNKKVVGNLTFVAALENGEAVLCNKISEKEDIVLKINRTGELQEMFYISENNDITGMLVIRDFLFILHQSGSMVMVMLEDITKQKEYHRFIEFNNIRHFSALSAYTEEIRNPDILLFVGGYREKLFVFNHKRRKLETRVQTTFIYPTSVSYLLTKSESGLTSNFTYVVCDMGSNKILIFDEQWKLIRTIQDDLFYPFATMPTPEGTILVSQYWNNTISEYDSNGNFLNRVININEPAYMSFSHPYLWVSDQKDVFRYKLYD